ncbi:hypothetical protein [Saccharothrix luteola]|uniref:hypothetical protein n=1 Tax=Saccharothrix luteola TaxID=2893018 RepID=UPI001E5BA87B|nr:hypothetical protein [Saccharothrix luteola]MCC8245611.1 hypothetical protein [Saccharothrix luteola]
MPAAHPAHHRHERGDVDRQARHDQHTEGGLVEPGRLTARPDEEQRRLDTGRGDREPARPGAA